MVIVEKYHGTGNDFVIVDAAEDLPDRRTFAVAVCDRESGITHPDAARTGADGVLYLSLSSDRDPPRVDMTLVQPDGSVAAMCGNGARCAAAWAGRRLDVEELTVDTPAGAHRAWITGDDVTVEMGQPSFDPERVPVEAAEPVVEREIAGLTVTAVDAGVPHAVAFVDDLAEVDLEAIGPAVRSAAIFPEGANVTLAAPRADGEGFDQRTFERGVEAETHSCGTGAVAIVAVAVRLGRLEPGRTVLVSPPGGDLEVTVTENGEGDAEGPGTEDGAGAGAEAGDGDGPGAEAGDGDGPGAGAGAGTRLRGPVVREFVDRVPAPNRSPGDGSDDG